MLTYTKYSLIAGIILFTQGCSDDPHSNVSNEDQNTTVQINIPEVTLPPTHEVNLISTASCVVQAGSLRQCNPDGSTYSVPISTDVDQRIPVETRLETFTIGNCASALPLKYDLVSGGEVVSTFDLFPAGKITTIPGRYPDLHLQKSSQSSYHNRFYVDAGCTIGVRATSNYPSATGIKQFLQSNLDQTTDKAIIFSQSVAIHGSFINQQDLALCNLNKMVKQFRLLYLVKTVSEIVQLGGKPVSDMLGAGVRTAHNTNSISIPEGVRAIKFLELEYNKSIAPLAEQKCSDSKPEDFRPNLESCNSNFACKNNVDQYLQVRGELEEISESTKYAFAYSRAVSQQPINIDLVSLIDTILK